MIESLFQAGVSNACVSLLIAIGALAVGLLMKRPKLSHFLWLLVLIKLVTPPLFNLPVPRFGLPTQVAALDRVEVEAGEPIHDFDPHLSVGAFPFFQEDSGVSSQNETTMQEEPQSRFAILHAFWTAATPWLGRIWLAGTVIIMVWSLYQIMRFQHLLNQNRSPAGKDLLQLANRIKNQLGLRALPKISTTTARLSPMVWWLGGDVHVIMPKVIIQEMKKDQWKWILAHEFAHVRRRDYLVRWLEWLACAFFWWNPIFWLAQRNIRAAEEICCDELVLSSLGANSYSYADSILAAVESLVIPEFRPPAMASEMNSGGFLKRRIDMILNGGSKQSSSSSLQYLIATMAMLLIPIGFVQAQDFDAIKKRLTRAVKNDEITLKQAAIMMEALREARNHEHEHEHEHDEHEHDEREHDERERDERERDEHERDERERSEEYHGDRNDEEIHEREMHEREMHEREMHERKLQQEMRNQEIRARELERANQLQKQMAAELEMINKRLKQEVREKQMTLQDYEAKMAAMQQAMEKKRREPSSDSKRSSDVNSILKAKYEQAVEKLEAGVRAGKLSKTEAKKRLDAFRKELWPEAKEKEEINKKLKFDDAAREIERMIESGQIKREDGKRRLEEMKRHFWGDERADWSRESRERDERVDPVAVKKERDQVIALQDAAKELKAAVENGKISKRQAEEKFVELRRRLKGDDKEE